MTTIFHSRSQRMLALMIVALLLTPLAALPAAAQMSTRKKAVLIGGAALLYYLYKKHQANREQANATTRPAPGQVARNQRTPQLYRSKNGGVYYRDAQNRPVWLTVPQQSVQVPASEIERYAPDYQQYNGPAPAAPRGYRTEPFGRLFGDTLGTSSNSGQGSVPGPRRGGF